MVLEVLQFVFSSFWVWLGCYLMLSVTFGGMREFIRDIANRIRK